MNKQIDTIIFDLGAVLIDWNPRHLYRKIFKTEDEITWFLENICTHEWNEKQDAGRPFEEATEELLQKFPEHEFAIRAWYDRWQETMNGPIYGTVEILKEIRDSKKYKLYALTNWSEQTFPWALEQFDRYQVNPANSLFIDDSLRNIEGAKAVGLPGIHFQSPEQLKEELGKIKIIDVK